MASLVVGNTFREAVRKAGEREALLKRANLDQNILRTEGGPVVNNMAPVSAAAVAVTTEKYPTQWGYQVLPSLYAIYQKVATRPTSRLSFHQSIKFLCCDDCVRFILVCLQYVSQKIGHIICIKTGMNQLAPFWCFYIT